MELNYGAWEGLVKRLREQEAFVAAMVADSHAQDYSDNVHRNLHYNLKIWARLARTHRNFKRILQSFGCLKLFSECMPNDPDFM